MFPSIEHKKKNSIGNSKLGKSPGNVRNNFYNPNKVPHYKQDYLKMVQKEANKKITDAIRHSSPFKNNHTNILMSNNVGDIDQINNAI